MAASSPRLHSDTFGLTRELAGILLAIGMLWGCVAAYVFLTLGGMTAPVYPRPAILALFFAGPTLLVIASTLVIWSRHRKLGSMMALAACIGLTALVAPHYTGLFYPKSLIRTNPSRGVIMAIIVFSADVSAILLLRRVTAI